MTEPTVDLLIDAIQDTQRAKQALDEALVRLAEIESDYNHRIKQPGADIPALTAARSAAEDELGIAGLIEKRQDAQRWAGLVDDCVRVCRRFSFEKVIVAQIRRLLKQHAGPGEDLDLFAMTLIRHVRHPEDMDIRQAARGILQRLRDHKPFATELA